MNIPHIRGIYTVYTFKMSNMDSHGKAGLSSTVGEIRPCKGSKLRL